MAFPPIDGARSSEVGESPQAEASALHPVPDMGAGPSSGLLGTPRSSFKTERSASFPSSYARSILAGQACNPVPGEVEAIL